MQEAAVGLLDAATVSNPPPHCGRRTQTAPMSTMAEDFPVDTKARVTVQPWKLPLTKRRVQWL
jgi:hypothetical protein